MNHRHLYLWFVNIVHKSYMGIKSIGIDNQTSIRWVNLYVFHYFFCIYMYILEPTSLGGASWHDGKPQKRSEVVVCLMMNGYFSPFLVLKKHLATGATMEGRDQTTSDLTQKHPN